MEARTRVARKLRVMSRDRMLLSWVVTAGVVAALIAAAALGLLTPAPSDPIVPLANWLSSAMDSFTRSFHGVFHAINWTLSWPLAWVSELLLWFPWPATLLIFAWLGYQASGWRLAAFCFLGLLYVVVTGYWDMAALTLALVCVAVPFSVIVGLFVGIFGARSVRVRRMLEPVLDLMQTVPTLAYLIPILVLFGIGPVVGVTASAIYAIPPMVRNVMLGLQRVPVEITESAVMAGSSRRQLLWWVQIPTTMPTILVGINQTVMAGLSMVVIAAMVGGQNDIGLEVFATMKYAKFGESLLAGLVIALLAMIMDRIGRGFADRRRDSQLRRDRRADRRLAYVFGAAILVALLLARLIPATGHYPTTWVIYPAAAMNRALDWLTQVAFPVTSALKTWVLFFLMLPLKIGLPQSVRPMFWGFTMTPLVSAVYVAVISSLCLLLGVASGWRAALGMLVAGMFYYFGTTGIPWPAVVITVSVLAYQVGGWRVCALAAGGLLFIVATGMWSDAMVSVELCTVGVLLSFVLGAALGIWAALNDRVSVLLRPVCDTLQTMPIFVFLIPAIMVFLVGEFTALISIIMYAIVPSIRYTEHGIRTVPAHVVEAARAMGSTRYQLLWWVQLPLALPEAMLGLNQTIMMGLAMVIVAALVGAKGLGEKVMVALGVADTGMGVVSGLCIALIAIIADRIIQSWSESRKRTLGLAEWSGDGTAV